MIKVALNGTRLGGTQKRMTRAGALLVVLALSAPAAAQPVDPYAAPPGQDPVLNEQIADKPFLCGARFSLADILLYCWIDFGGQVGQPLDAANTNIAKWFARVGERPSVKA